MTNRWPLSGLAALSTLFVPLAVSAQDAAEWTCVQGDLQRRVAIFYETGVAVPCEVQYFKDTEAPGDQQVLWRALNESGYLAIPEFAQTIPEIRSLWWLRIFGGVLFGAGLLVMAANLFMTWMDGPPSYSESVNQLERQRH